MARDNTGTHAAHCCAKHGCKYGTDQYCVNCDHPISYHTEDRGCTMPVVPGTNIPKSRNDYVSAPCGCKAAEPNVCPVVAGTVKQEFPCEYCTLPMRVWWIPQVPGKPFTVEISTVDEGLKLCEVLANYDLFQYNNKIKPDYANMGGIEFFDSKADCWVSVDPDDTDDVAELRRLAGEGVLR